MGVIYSEASFFDGAHFKHIADWQDNCRLAAIAKRDNRLINANESAKLRARWFVKSN